MEIIFLNLPIKIRKTIDNNGYVITDNKENQYFFYEKEKNSDEMRFDGFSLTLKKSSEK